MDEIQFHKERLKLCNAIIEGSLDADTGYKIFQIT